MVFSERHICSTTRAKTLKSLLVNKKTDVSFITSYWQLWSSIACVQCAFLWLWNIHYCINLSFYCIFMYNWS